MAKRVLTFKEHAVRRMFERKVPIDVAVNVAQCGVVVHENENFCMKRGDWIKKPVHVVIDKHLNTIVTVYVADEWESVILVRRIGKTKNKFGFKTTSAVSAVN